MTIAPPGSSTTRPPNTAAAPTGPPGTPAGTGGFPDSPPSNTTVPPDTARIVPEFAAAPGDMFSADRFHPSPAGYAVIAEALSPYLRAAAARAA